MVADFGCLGCAFKSGKYLSPFMHAILSDKLYAAPHTICSTELFHAAHRELRFLWPEAGATPRGPVTHRASNGGVAPASGKFWAACNFVLRDR
jgi:hypothetical protein